MAKSRKKAVETKKSPNDIIAYRKKRKQRNNIIKLLSIGLVLVGIALIWTNAGTIFEPLRGIASKIDTRTTEDVGFPVNLPGSASYSFADFGDNFLLLTDTYLYTYTTGGGQIYALKHGYTNAVQRANDKRILLYDKSSYDFSLYNRTSRIYDQTVDDKIVYGALSSGDLCAIVTTSPKYSNLVKVFDGSGNWKYTRKFVDENVMQVEFTEDEKSIIVTTIGVQSGDIVCNVYKFSIDGSESEVWKYSLVSNSIPCAIDAKGKNITVLCDNICFTLNESDGSLMGSYAFSGTLICPVLEESFTAILVNNISTSSTVLLTLDDEMNVMGSISVPSNTVDIVADGSVVYALEGEDAVSYDRNLNETGRVKLKEEYSAFLKIGGDYYLLGYDKVEKERVG